jgi:hypothetical protein
MFGGCPAGEQPLDGFVAGAPEIDILFGRADDHSPRSGGFVSCAECLLDVRRSAARTKWKESHVIGNEGNGR